MKPATLILLFAAVASAQRVITTFVGTSLVFPGDGKPAINAPLGRIDGLTMDPAGNLVLTDNGNCISARIGADGILSVIAGYGQCDYRAQTGDGGPATSASVGSVNATTFDSSGNFYVASDTFRLRKVDPAGVIRPFAGAQRGFGGDGGPATNASFRFEFDGLACDAQGNVYVSDTQNNRIRKIARDGTVSTFAGSGAALSSGDGGPAAAAGISSPRGITFDSAGNLYIAEGFGQRVRKVTPGGVISTVVSGISASSVAVDASGTLYVGVFAGIYKVAPGSSSAVLIAGTGRGDFEAGFSGDGGPALNARFNGEQWVVAGPGGVVYVGDQQNHRIRRIGADGIVTTIAGNGNYRYSGENVPRLAAPLSGPAGLAVDPRGNLYFAEFDNNRIRKVSAGLVSTVAGTGAVGSAGNGGPAINATLNTPRALAFDAAGNLYFAENNGAGLLRKITPAGTISTTTMRATSGVAVDGAGNVYASGLIPGSAFTSFNFPSFISKMSPDGVVTRFAGKDTTGFSGDGGPAIDALFNNVGGLVFDKDGNLYAADGNNNRVRKITPAGVITTIAGTGESDGSTPGPATQTPLPSPSQLVFDAAGNLYIGCGDGRVRKVTPQGIMSTFAGGVFSSQLGDGKVATEVQLGPNGLAVDSAGNLYVSDRDRIRVVLAAPPFIDVLQTTLSFSGASAGSPVSQNLTVRGSLAGLEFRVASDSPGWLSADVSSASTPRLVNITADPTRLAPGRYAGTIRIQPLAAAPAEILIDVTFDVGPALAPKLSLDLGNLSLTFPRGASQRSSPLVASNSGGGVINFTAAASTNDGGRWLSITPGAGRLTPGSPVTLTVSADPSGLDAGTYSGRIELRSDTAGNVTLPVTITISSLTKALLLTQAGLSFRAVSQGGVIPAQSFGVVNLGTGELSWTASTSTLSGGPNWLRVTPASGSSDANAAVPQVSVSMNPAGLAPGVYYGLVSITAGEAANTPQVVTVFLEVLPAGSDTGAIVQPPELVFPVQTGIVPGALSLLVFNVSAEPKAFRTDRADTGAPFFAFPQEGVLDPRQPMRILIQPATTATSAGLLSFQFSDGRVIPIRLTLVPSADNATLSNNVGPTKGAARAAQCSPTRLTPALLTLGQSFAVSAGWPVALGVEVRDDCGNLQKSGSVTVSFSNGDPPLSLQSLNDGTWQGTWQTRTSTLANVKLLFEARDPARQVSGSREVEGLLGSPKDPPSLAANSVGSAAGFVSYSPLAPGGIITVFGNHLASATEQNQGLPLPTRLSDTRVIIAGKSVPLFFVSEKQINGQLPSGLTINTNHQILVLRGLTYSRPVPITVGPAQPAAFLFGDNAAIAVAYRGSDAFLVTTDRPARAGDVLVIYCTGLGLTDVPVADGVASPDSPPAQTKAPVTLSIGGRAGQVTYAGLVAGFAGLYQVNAIVPDGVPSSDVSPLVLTVAGQTGPTSFLPVR